MSSFRMQQNLGMKQQQQLRMTQQLQQAIKLLQLSRQELVSHIQQEMAENPTLEEAALDETPTTIDDVNKAEADEFKAAAEKKKKDKETREQQQTSVEPVDAKLEKNTLEKEHNQEQEIDWDAYFEYQNGGALPSNSYKGMITDELPSVEATLSAPPNLAEHLMWQVRMTHFDESEERVAVHIIGNLDEDGYFTGLTLEELAERAEVDRDAAEYVLEVIQEMDPVGVGARDLRECLLAQAEVLHPDDDVLHDIIEHHMNNLKRKNYDAIARATKLSLEEVLRAAKLVSQMDPKPGRKYSDEQPQYITPDIYIHKIGEDYHVLLNEDGLPKLRISSHYSKMIKQGQGKEVSNYVREKLSGARWLIRSIHQRQRTILRVTEAIVRKQREFLDKGVAYLRPMVLKDIAEETDLHESTISRVTSKKYVHTPQGTFELKYFFNSRITRMGGEDLASESVKENIRSIIAKEDPKKPYSDQKIVSILRKQKIKIARRTVAKYREALGILSSTQRKSYF